MNVYADPRYQAREVRANGQSFGQGLREFVLASIGIETYSRQAFLDVAKDSLIEAIDSFLSEFVDEIINPTDDVSTSRPGIDAKVIDSTSIKDHGNLLNAAIKSHHASKVIKVALGFDHGREEAVKLPKAPKGWTKTHGNVARSIDANGKHRGCWYRIVEREKSAVDSLDSLPECALNGTLPIGHEVPSVGTGPVEGEGESRTSASASDDAKRINNLEWISRHHEQRQAHAVASMVEKKEAIHRLRVSRLQARVTKLRSELKALKAQTQTPAPVPVPVPVPVKRRRKALVR